jgi:hypothetical protein
VIPPIGDQRCARMPGSNTDASTSAWAKYGCCSIWPSHMSFQSPPSHARPGSRLARRTREVGAFRSVMEELREFDLRLRQIAQLAVVRR